MLSHYNTPADNWSVMIHFLYTGARSAESLVAWLKKKSGPPSLEVNSVKEINEQLDLHGAIVLAFFRVRNVLHLFQAAIHTVV